MSTAGPTAERDAIAPAPSPSPVPRRRRPVMTDSAPLARVGSSQSTYSAASFSLRRMATHETGELVDSDSEDGGLSTHEEHEHEHEHDHEHENEHKHGQGTNETERGRQGLGSDQAHAVTPNLPATDDNAVHTTNKDIPPTGDSPSDKADKSKYEIEDQTNLLPVRQVIMIFMGLNCALFCSLLDQTIVTTALPTLGRVFNQTSISSWVGTAYMLTSTALQPVYGRLSDIWGRKNVLLGSLLIFLIGSIAASVAQSMIQLIIFRAIQGIGGGGILTLSMIIISDVVSLRDRGKYQGVIGMVVALANSLGPVLGGIFTEKLNWRWCFYINLPLSVIAIVVIFFLLPLKKVHGSWRAKLKKLDFYGSILTLAWAVLVLLALSWSGAKYSWSSAAVIAPLVIGIVLLGVFIYVEAKVVPLPLIPMYIFKNGTVAASMATTFGNGAAFFCSLYYLPQYFQIVRGQNPLDSGVSMLPLVFVQVFCSFCSGFLVSKTGDYKWNLMAGFAIWTVGMGMMSTIHPTTPKAHIYGFQVLVGVGAGQTFQTSLIAIQASVGRKDMATATGCRNFLRMLGGTVSLAACAAIINNLVKNRLNELRLGSELVSRILQAPTELEAMGLSSSDITHVREAYAKAIDACFLFCVPLTAISFLITVFFIKRVPLKRGDEAELKAQAKAWIEEQKGKKRDEEEGSPSSDTLAEHEGKHDEKRHREVDNVEKAAAGMDEAVTGVSLRK